MASSSASAAAAAEPRSESEVISRYQAMQEELNAVQSQIYEFEGQRNEHREVLKKLQPMDGSRRCMRMVGGVLVERTVAEVAPAVQRNLDGLVEHLSKLEARKEEKKLELTKYIEKYKIRLTSKADEARAAPQAKNQGVLVSGST